MMKNVGFEEDLSRAPLTSLPDTNETTTFAALSQDPRAHHAQTQFRQLYVLQCLCQKQGGTLPENAKHHFAYPTVMYGLISQGVIFREQ